MKKENYYGLFREIKSIIDANSSEFERASYVFRDNFIGVELSSGSMSSKMVRCIAEFLNNRENVGLIIDSSSIGNSESLILSFYISED